MTANGSGVMITIKTFEQAKQENQINLDQLYAKLFTVKSSYKGWRGLWNWFRTGRVNLQLQEQTRIEQAITVLEANAQKFYDISIYGHPM